MAGDESNPPVPMGEVIAKELELVGSHGMQAFEYGRMLNMITIGILKPELLISDQVGLEDIVRLLPAMNQFPGSGVTVAVL